MMEISENKLEYFQIKFARDYYPLFAICIFYIIDITNKLLSGRFQLHYLILLIFFIALLIWQIVSLILKYKRKQPPFIFLDNEGLGGKFFKYKIPYSNIKQVEINYGLFEVYLLVHLEDKRLYVNKLPFISRLFIRKKTPIKISLERISEYPKETFEEIKTFIETQKNKQANSIN